MYDIIYLYDIKKENKQLKSLRERFPLIKVIKYNDNVYDAFIRARKISITKFFWIINLDHDDIFINDDFNFNYVVPEWDKIYVHIWQTPQKDFNNIYLISKNYPFTKNEAKHMFFINKKEMPENIFKYETIFNERYDMFFISYNETNAEENWKKLLEKFPDSKRIHGVKGIHNAHIEAANRSTTSMFWVIDGDSQIVKDFNFDYIVDPWDKDAVFVWKSQNPINELSYGNGGVKLLPKKLTMKLDTSSIDMTTSISKKFNPIDKISNITMFNIDPFNTWKSAFRECVKLSSKIINSQNDIETETRLNVWCTVGIDRPFGEYAIKGANAGKEFGTKYINDKTELSKINDWEWLENEFRKISEN